jgi:hypothetical protein
MEEKRRLKISLTNLRSEQMRRWRGAKNKISQAEAYNTVIHIDMFRKLQSSVDIEIA